MFVFWARVDVETSLGGGACGLWGESVLKPSTVIVLSNHHHHHQPARTGPGHSLVSQTISMASVEPVETVESLETGAG